jgi:hypothetical protein
MMIKKALAALVATSLVGTPLVAQAAASSTARVGSPVADAENIRGGWFIPLLAFLAILLGIIILIDDGGDLPTSP